MTPEDLLNILKQLTEKEFNVFQWRLKRPGLLAGYGSIAPADLEKADRLETVDLLVKTYELHGAVKVTKEILKEIPRMDLLQNLSDSSSGAEALSSNLRELDLTHHQTSAGVQRSRGELRKYSCELTVDTNTVNRYIKLSDNNRKMTYVKEVQSYPHHPERFDWYHQLLCRTGLTGRCYWEVEWRGAVTISVSYRRIRRKGNSKDCKFGENDHSWVLKCSDDGLYYVRHNEGETVLSSSSSPSSSSSSSSSSYSYSGRVAVYVDCPAGTLSCYRVSSDSLIHLYTFNTTFTEPLYPGFGLWSSSGSSVSLCGV